MSNIKLYPANERGTANHGWLKTAFSFSFSGYYDPKKIHFGALRVLNDDIIAGGMGFGKHPHDNMEIITIVLEGALEHQDSMGHTQALHPNEVQVMSAGTGIFHSEYNHNANKEAKLLQIWIFPDKQGVKPRYDQKVFDAAERQNAFQTLVSPIDKEDKGLKIHQNAWISRATLEGGQHLTYKLNDSNNGAYIFLIEGSAIANDTEIERRDALGIADSETVTFTARTTSDILLIEVPMTL
jgi:redox-sensitive bicupin YhaK (pirin superfamily)